MLEVLQLNSPSTQNEEVSPSIIYGSWRGGDDTDQEGLECQLESLESAQFFFTPSILDVSQHVDGSEAPRDIGKDASLGQSPCRTKQLNRLKRALHRFFSRRKRRQTRNSLKSLQLVQAGTNQKETSPKDDGSVATTVAASSMGSLDDDDDMSVATVPVSNVKEIPSVEPLVMELFLRLRLEQEGLEIEVALPSEKADNSTDQEDIPLIQTRLLESGVIQSPSDFEFVADKVSKGFESETKNEEDKPYDGDQGHGVSHVKTGIWEVTRFNEKGEAEEPFYIVTGVSMDDRVDTKKLRKAVFGSGGNPNTRRPKLSMAPTHIAEKLAGYKSGTMAPICHTVDMKLYLEETLAKTHGSHRINVGSGMSGKCLSLPAEKFLAVASRCSEGMEAHPLVQKRKQPKD